ncbi:MAG: GGDEF and EAL domain-containing protein [Pseudomonadota bacterium]
MNANASTLVRQALTAGLGTSEHEHLSETVASEQAPAQQQDAGLSTTDILRVTGVATYDWNVNTDTISWSANSHEVLGLASDHDITSGRDFTSIVSPDADVSRIEVVLDLASQGANRTANFDVEYPLITSSPGSDGEEHPIWVEDCGRVFIDRNGMPQRVVGTMRVVNERRDRHEALTRMSHFDTRSGLMNRDRLTELLEEDVDRVRREHGSGAFIIIGIEHMHLINEMYGFGIGDEIVREAGRRIEAVMRLNDSLGRYAGTKVALVLRDCTEREMLIACERFLSALRDEVIETSVGPVSLSVNIGGVIYPHGAREVADVMGAAGSALAEARRAPVPTVQVFEPSVDLTATRQQNAFTAQEVVDAMRERRMRLAYQPIVDAHTHEVAFHEALIRMVDADGQLVEAGAFVGVASRLGLIRRVDFAAMQLATETLIECPDAVLSLNVTNETAVDPEWLSSLATIVDANPQIAPRLIVEITESHAARNLDESIRFVRTIQDLGCRVAIDDFGAGYTSFANLKHLPVDMIKIDGMYVDDLANSAENQVFIKSLLDLAKVFSTKVVVEWVSDDETAALLRDWGVDYLQGQNFGRAIVEGPWAKNTPEPEAG